MSGGGYVSLPRDEDLELNTTELGSVAHANHAPAASTSSSSSQQLHFDSECKQVDSGVEKDRPFKKSGREGAPSHASSDANEGEAPADPDDGMSIKHHLTCLLTLTGPNAMASLISSWYRFLLGAHCNYFSLTR